MAQIVTSLNGRNSASDDFRFDTDAGPMLGLILEYAGILVRRLSRRTLITSPPQMRCVRKKSRTTFRNSSLRWKRSEEHTSELQSLMRISYAVFCLKKKKKQTTK